MFLTTLALAFTGLIHSVNAACANLADVRFATEGHDFIETDDDPPVASLACPKDSKERCSFNISSYHIVANRELSLRGIPDNEVDAIFDLAKEALFRNIDSLSMRNGTNTYANSSTFSNTGISTNLTFSNLEGNVSFTYRNSLETAYTVPPGTKKALRYVWYHHFVSGTLQNCTNSTLNNVSIRASAPFYFRDAQNRTVIAGGWVVAQAGVASVVSISTGLLVTMLASCLVLML